MQHRKRLHLQIVVLSTLLCLLAACSPSTIPAHSSATPSPHAQQTAPATPTATAQPAATVLYQANWSHGLDGWQAAHGWQVDAGKLLVESTANTTITAPYRPATPDYAIEASIQVVRFLQPGAQFWVFANDAPGQDGYIAGAISLTPPADGPPGLYAGYAQAAPNELDYNQGGFSQSDFAPGYNVRTYRVEVQGNELSFYIDGVRIDSTYSTKPALSTGPLGILSDGLVLQVSSFIITTL
jgi:hypothetical protein